MKRVAPIVEGVEQHARRCRSGAAGWCRAASRWRRVRSGCDSQYARRHVDVLVVEEHPGLGRSVAGLPSSGSCCTKSPIGSVVLVISSSSLPSMRIGLVTRTARTATCPALSRETTAGATGGGASPAGGAGGRRRPARTRPGTDTSATGTHRRRAGHGRAFSWVRHRSACQLRFASDSLRPILILVDWAHHAGTCRTTNSSTQTVRLSGVAYASTCSATAGRCWSCAI